jgi:hypothetical protein
MRDGQRDSSGLLQPTSERADAVPAGEPQLIRRARDSPAALREQLFTESACFAP